MTQARRNHPSRAHPSRERKGAVLLAGIRHLPVFSHGRLLGLVTMRDLLLADLEEKGHEVRLMRAYISIPPPEQ